MRSAHELRSQRGLGPSAAAPDRIRIWLALDPAAGATGPRMAAAETGGPGGAARAPGRAWEDRAPFLMTEIRAGSSIGKRFSKMSSNDASPTQMVLACARQSSAAASSAAEAGSHHSSASTTATSGVSTAAVGTAVRTAWAAARRASAPVVLRPGQPPRHDRLAARDSAGQVFAVRYRHAPARSSARRSRSPASPPG